MKQGWEYKRLGNVCDLRRGLTYSKDDEAAISSNLVLRSNNIDLDSMILDLTEIKYLKDSFTIPSEKKLKGGSVFLCMSNGSKHHVGKVAYIEKDMDFAFGGFMGLIVPLDRLFPKFVYYVCRSSLWRGFMDSIGKGIGITNLRFSELADFSIPVPSIDEQKAICSLLDKMNRVIEAKKEQLKELDNLAQAIFYDMFGDPVENNKAWESKPISSIGELSRGVSKHRPRNAPELLGGTMPLIQTGDVSNSGMYIRDYSSTYSELGVLQSRVWHKGTLCITIAANIGKCSILTFDACFPDSVVGFIPYDNALVEYMYFAFSAIQNTLEENAMGVAQKNINLTILNQLVLAVPPLDKQQAFAEKVKAIERQKELINQSIKDVQTLFDAKMDYYFGD